MSFHMKNAKARRGLQAAITSLFALVASAAHAEWGGLNMTEGVSILSRKIYGLHMTIFWWCVAIGIAVFGAMIYSLVKFRKSQGRAYEVGKFLSEEERHRLAAELQQLIGGMNQSPALPHSGSPV